MSPISPTLKEKENALVHLLSALVAACKVVDDDEFQDLAYDLKEFCKQSLSDEELEEFLHIEHQIAIWQIRTESGWDDNEDNGSELDSYESDGAAEFSDSDDLDDLSEYAFLL